MHERAERKNTEEEISNGEKKLDSCAQKMGRKCQFSIITFK